VPGLEEPFPPKVLERSKRQWKEALEVIHHFIVPSEAVAKSLVEMGARREFIHLVPYRVPSQYLALTPKPVPGRMLFIGSATLGKGIHTLAAAARQLSDKRIQIRVAGSIGTKMREFCAGSELVFLGRIPRSEIIEEFLQADALVLPTLTEGSSEATYEALGAGLPVITTPAAGSVVRDGIEGFIVSERDPQALAGQMDLLMRDRPLRGIMAANARKRAAEFTEVRYEERLKDVFMRECAMDGRE
jgi:glycosyltransferase involved in cell wall biosynthesis